jgi:putative phosphoribosyl transferase
MMQFANRREAGRALATRLDAYARRDDVIVLALPRGGVPVAYEVARALGAPLDLFLVRKVGVPGHEELAMGAVAEGGIGLLNEDLIRDLRISPEAVTAVVEREREALARREAEYANLRSGISVRGRVVILVDDGLATGMSMEAAVKALRTLAPSRVVVAVPVGAEDTCRRLGALADEVICAMVPPYFEAVGLWYQDFRQTEDGEVAALMRPSP